MLGKELINHQKHMLILTYSNHKLILTREFHLTSQTKGDLLSIALQPTKMSIKIQSKSQNQIILQPKGQAIYLLSMNLQNQAAKRMKSQ